MRDAFISFFFTLWSDKDSEDYAEFVSLQHEKLLCPQCKIAAMYVKNEQGDRLLVYVLEDGEVVPKYPEDSMEGFDLTEVFCLGCSWHGSPKRLVKR